jgi:ribosome biogenesis GTPase
LETGKVIKSVGSRYKVLLASGKIVECLLRGKVRVNQLKKTNPVAVGDNVKVEISDSSGNGFISDLLERKNYILRKASNLSKQSQIIAANIDQVLLMITIVFPQTPVEFIDRFLITAEAYRIPARLIFNKTDLYEAEELDRLGHLISVYTI